VVRFERYLRILRSLLRGDDTRCAGASTTMPAWPNTLRQLGALSYANSTSSSSRTRTETTAMRIQTTRPIAGGDSGPRWLESLVISVLLLGSHSDERPSSAAGRAGRALNLGKTKCPPCLLQRLDNRLSLKWFGRVNLLDTAKKLCSNQTTQARLVLCAGLSALPSS
jgi:hypothetical protein